jgi:hypothetical protein
MFKRKQYKYHYIRMALSLCSSAASRIGLTQSPLKTSADFLHLGELLNTRFAAICELELASLIIN